MPLYPTVLVFALLRFNASSNYSACYCACALVHVLLDIDRRFTVRAVGGVVLFSPVLSITAAPGYIFLLSRYCRSSRLSFYRSNRQVEEAKLNSNVPELNHYCPKGPIQHSSVYQYVKSSFHPTVPRRISSGTWNPIFHYSTTPKKVSPWPSLFG